MKQLLVDFDSRIPNLALMKVAAYYKARGDPVTLIRPEWKARTNHAFMPRWYRSRDYGQLWVSCVFTWNKDEARRIFGGIPHARLGGTGFDWGKDLNDPTRVSLPPEMEWTPPDYSIYDGVHFGKYKKNDRAVGFFLRGCNRKCGFCDVWRKEGTIKPAEYWPLWAWCPDSFKLVLGLDNEMALYPDAIHDKIINDVRSSGRRLSITQGYDIRVIAKKPERAKILAENKPYDLKFREHTLYIAWDYLGIEPAVRKGLQALLDAGFKGREITCFTIVGYETEHYRPTMADYLHRHEVLWKEFGVHPFVMVYNHANDPKLRAFARWTNRKIFKSRNADTFGKYLQGDDAGKATPADFDPLEAYGV